MKASVWHLLRAATRGHASGPQEDHKGPPKQIRTYVHRVKLPVSLSLCCKRRPHVSQMHQGDERAIAGQVNGQVKPHWRSNLIDVHPDLPNSFGEGGGE